jgi:fucose permease
MYRQLLIHDSSDSLWLKVLHLFIFGTLNSLQFVGMNTLTLKDLPQHDASSGNSFLSMIMMLSI